jgi:hypothetical protein
MEDAGLLLKLTLQPVGTTRPGVVIWLHVLAMAPLCALLHAVPALRRLKPRIPPGLRAQPLGDLPEETDTLYGPCVVLTLEVAGKSHGWGIGVMDIRPALQNAADYLERARTRAGEHHVVFVRPRGPAGSPDPEVREIYTLLDLLMPSVVRYMHGHELTWVEEIALRHNWPGCEIHPDPAALLDLMRARVGMLRQRLIDLNVADDDTAALLEAAATALDGLGAQPQQVEVEPVPVNDET